MQMSMESKRALGKNDSESNAGCLVSEKVREHSETIAKGLGWFSIALGAAELLAPRTVSRVAGFRGESTLLVRAFGLREIAAGVAVLTTGRRPERAMWSRVAGDVLDLAVLGRAVAGPNTNKVVASIATANVLLITALDVLTAQDFSRSKGKMTDSGDVRVEASLFINKPPADLYRFWRNFRQLPSFMRHLESVTIADDGTSHWVAKAPAGTKVEWDARLTEDIQNESIKWESLPGSQISNKGSVRFEPTLQGAATILRVVIEYSAPGGMLGAAVARMFREEPLPQVKDDLRRFKQIMEVGEIVLSDGSRDGNGRMFQHPAQPAE